MNSHSRILLIMLLGAMLMKTMTESALQRWGMSGCQTRCGDINVPFPFGIGPNCSLDESFNIACNTISNHSKAFLRMGEISNHSKAFLRMGEIEVIDISLLGQMRIAASVASDCYDKSGSPVNGSISELALSEFHISSTQNKFTVIGCDTHAYLQRSNKWNQRSVGCVSLCGDIKDVVNGSCSGIGCCQSSISKGLKDFSIDITSFQNHSRVETFNPCGYAFVVEAEAFKFSSLDLKDLQKQKTVPVVLDWSIGNVACQVAQKNLSTYACRAMHSQCIDSSNGLGYHCSCSTGFEGNPYLVDGCRDIDECVSTPCEGTCINTLGSYLCSCPKGFDGDGKKDGTGCHPKHQTKISTWMYIASGLIFPAVGSSWIFWESKKKKVVKLRHKYFVENGGLKLQKLLSGSGGLKIFTAEDLNRATNNYDEITVVNRDRYYKPMVYKGTLPHNGETKHFFIQRYGTVYSSDIHDFISKLVKISRITHKNVVGLIGCCLETPDLFLVYEFFTGKTLYDSINDQVNFLSWDRRLQIAFDTARSVAFLHSDCGVAHGDITSLSIVLNSVYNIKVAMPLLSARSDTYGYSYTKKLAEKDDIYSFGVVLAELLTGDTVTNFREAEYFFSAIREDRLLEILPPRLVSEAKIEQLKHVAMLAERCLRQTSEETPKMEKVAMELKGVLSTLELDKDRAQLNLGTQTAEAVDPNTSEHKASRFSRFAQAIRQYHFLARSIDSPPEVCLES